jgi:hypothetical protein
MLSYYAKGINKFTAVNRVGAFRRPANCECQLSCSAFNKFTHSNRPAAVQHPFWGDVSPLHPLRSSAKLSFQPSNWQLAFERGLARTVRGFESLTLRHTDSKGHKGTK